ncbi:MAG: hypothetical protein H6Q82_2158, partial [Deltaproteobacteria bacterium]|nr:hypothetical protein [Deltaproteobacteria bacterium]
GEYPGGEGVVPPARKVERGGPLRKILPGHGGGGILNPSEGDIPGSDTLGIARTEGDP